MGVGLISSIVSSISRGGTPGGLAELSIWNGSDYQTRGAGYSGIKGVDKNTTQITTIGFRSNGDENAIEDKVLSDFSDDANKKASKTNGDAKEDYTLTDLMHGLFGQTLPQTSLLEKVSSIESQVTTLVSAKANTLTMTIDKLTGDIKLQQTEAQSQNKGLSVNLAGVEDSAKNILQQLLLQAFVQSLMGQTHTGSGEQPDTEQLSQNFKTIVNKVSQILDVSQDIEQKMPMRGL